MIVVDADGLFSGISKKNFQATLIIILYTVTSRNHKAIRNEEFYRYLNKLHKINSAEKGSLHQWLQEVFFVLYDWNAGPVDGNDIS